MVKVLRKGVSLRAASVPNQDIDSPHSATTCAMLASTASWSRTSTLIPKALPPVAAISTTSKRSNITAISLGKDQAAQEGVELDDDTLRVARLGVHGLTATALDPALSHLVASVEQHEYLPMLCG